MTKNIEPRHYDVILSPVVTEKATIASEHQQRDGAPVLADCVVTRA